MTLAQKPPWEKKSETYPNRSKREKKMDTNKMTSVLKDRKVILSTLWIFAMFNYIYADVFSVFFDPTAQQEALTFAGFALVFAVLMETAIAMVLLSRVLNYAANRWANIIVAVLHTASVAWSLFGDTPKPFYVLFATVEIACTLFIIWYAWTWRNPEG
jgi:hypothetical protein